MNQTELDLTQVSPSEEHDASVEQISDDLFAAATGENVKFQLSIPGIGTRYLSVTDKGWCVASDSASEFTKFLVNNQYYYQLINNNTKFNKRWMSGKRIGNQHPVGIYRKYLRSSFTLKNGNLIWDHNKKPLSIKSTETGFLYANSGSKFTTVGVKEIAI